MSDEQTTAIQISGEARAEAIEVVADWPGRPSAQHVSALIEAIAARIQYYMNCAELAEAERRQAVRTANKFSRHVSDTAQTALIPEWVSCPRCGVRAESTLDIRHLPGCRHSTLPPAPRRSLPPTSGGEEG